jgi:copper chaperone CopZ
MVRSGIWLGAALTLAAVTPGFAAPMLKATVGHLCCGGCDAAVKRNTATVAWAGDTQTDRGSKSVSVTPKAGMQVDAMALYTALQSGGFPPTAYQLSGGKTIKMDVGHLCCGGCVNPLKAELGKVSWVKNADVQANAPVTLTLDPAQTVDLSELIAIMMKAGYAPKSMLIDG